MPHDLGLLLAREAALLDRHMRRQRGEHGQLAGERLGRGDADFRPCVRGQQQIRLARHRAGGHVDDHADGLAMRLAMPERGERVGGLPALRDEQCQPAVFEHGIAIAELGCDIDIDRNARELFEPVFRDQPRIETGAAGDDRQPADLREVEIDLRQRDRIVRTAQIGAKRLRHHGGLLVNLLLHEVAIIALLHRRRRRARGADFAGDGIALRIEHLGTVAAHHDPVAFFEIGDPLRQRRKRERIRTQIHLRLLALGPIAEHQRRAEPRADQHVGMRAERDRQCKGAAQPRQDVAHRFDRVGAALDLGRDQVRDHFAVGLAFEDAARSRHFAAQFLVILDDAVVHDRDLAGCVRVRVRRGRRAVGGPAGVRDPDIAGRRVLFEHRDQIGQPPFGAAAHQRAIVQRADARTVITAIFHAPQPIDQAPCNAACPDDTDNAAHRAGSSFAGVSAALARRPLTASPSNRGGGECLGKKQPFRSIHHAT